jgi:hypothetical protein
MASPPETTATGVEVLSGERELTLSAPGFMPLTQPLSIVAGVDQDLGAVTLTPADATLTLESTPPGAGVTVDGAFAGLTPLVVPLSPGDRHAISLSKAGYLGANLSLTLARGGNRQSGHHVETRVGRGAFCHRADRSGHTD